MDEATTGAPVEVWTIVVAAGGGSRFGGPKQYAALAGQRVLDWSLAAAGHASHGVVLVVPAAQAEVPEPGADAVVAGGRTRSESVRCGLAAVPEAADVVVVHDGARPAAGPDLFAAVVEAVVAGADAAVPGVALADSIRRRDGGAVDRDALVAVQTPQAFRAAALRRAHASAGEACGVCTATSVSRSTALPSRRRTLSARATPGTAASAPASTAATTEANSSGPAAAGRPRRGRPPRRPPRGRHLQPAADRRRAAGAPRPPRRRPRAGDLGRASGTTSTTPCAA